MREALCRPAICLTAGAAAAAAAASFVGGSRTCLAGLAAESFPQMRSRFWAPRFRWGEAEPVPRQRFLYSHRLRHLEQDYPLRAHSGMGCWPPERRSPEPLALVPQEQAALRERPEGAEGAAGTQALALPELVVVVAA